MRLFFVAPDLLAPVVVGQEIVLPEDVSHHLKTVLRSALGTEVVVSDGCGSCCRCSVVNLNAGGAVVVVNECRFVEETALAIELLQGLPGGDKLELVLQKNTELGVTTFQPLLTERSQFRVPAHKLARKMARWQRIVSEAARQSERAWLPHVAEPRSVADALKQSSAELKLALWEQGTRPLKEVLPLNKPESVAVLVGPEGGLTEAEITLAREHGFIPVGIGPRILRTETAGMAMAAILQFHYGDFDLLPKGGHRLTSTEHR